MNKTKTKVDYREGRTRLNNKIYVLDSFMDSLDDDLKEPVLKMISRITYGGIIRVHIGSKDPDIVFRELKDLINFMVGVDTNIHVKKRLEKLMKDHDLIRSAYYTGMGTRLCVNPYYISRHIPNSIMPSFSERVFSKYIKNFHSCLYSNKSSLGESTISSLLDYMDVKYLREFAIGKKRYDFKLPNNVLLEFDGKQHFEDSKIFGTTFEDQYNNDRLKDKLASENGYKVIRISHSEINEIDKIMCLLGSCDFDLGQDYSLAVFGKQYDGLEGALHLKAIEIED